MSGYSAGSSPGQLKEVLENGYASQATADRQLEMREACVPIKLLHHIMHGAVEKGEFEPCHATTDPRWFDEEVKRRSRATMRSSAARPQEGTDSNNDEKELPGGLPCENERHVVVLNVLIRGAR
jgi:hypothetical protein